MYDTISNRYRNHFYNHNEAGAKPDPYNPDWVKKDGKWYYKGELYQDEKSIREMLQVKPETKPKKLNVKGELARRLAEKTGEDFNKLNSKEYTTAQLREWLSDVLKSEMKDKK